MCLEVCYIKYKNKAFYGEFYVNETTLCMNIGRSVFPTIMSPGQLIGTISTLTNKLTEIVPSPLCKDDARRIHVDPLASGQSLGTVTHEHMKMNSASDAELLDRLDSERVEKRRLEDFLSFIERRLPRGILKRLRGEFSQNCPSLPHLTFSNSLLETNNVHAVCAPDQQAGPSQVPLYSAFQAGVGGPGQEQAPEEAQQPHAAVGGHLG